MISRKEKVEFKVENLSVAEVRYFSKEDNGVEFTDPVSYVFLVNRDEVYFNPFDFGEYYPVFKRVPYSNTTRLGEDYGSKMRLAGNSCDLKSGPCCVLCNIDMKELFGRDTVSEEVLKKYMMHSEKYFKDRELFFEESVRKYPLTTLLKAKKDRVNKEKMINFFEERGVQLQKVR